MCSITPVAPRRSSQAQATMINIMDNGIDGFPVQ
jgi:hypothetical protein